MSRNGPEEHRGLSAVNSPPQMLFLVTRLFLPCLLTEWAPACSSAVTTATCCKDPKVSPVSESQTHWLPGVTTGPSAEVSSPLSFHPITLCQICGTGGRGEGGSGMDFNKRMHLQSTYAQADSQKRVQLGCRCKDLILCVAFKGSGVALQNNWLPFTWSPSVTSPKRHHVALWTVDLQVTESQNHEQRLWILLSVAVSELTFVFLLTGWVAE